MRSFIYQRIVTTSRTSLLVWSRSRRFVERPSRDTLVWWSAVPLLRCYFWPLLSKGLSSRTHRCWFPAAACRMARAVISAAPTGNAQLCVHIPLSLSCPAGRHPPLRLSETQRFRTPGLRHSPMPIRRNRLDLRSSDLSHKLSRSGARGPVRLSSSVSNESCLMTFGGS